MSIRLRQIALVANKLAPVIDDLKAVFGLEVCYIDPGVGAFGLENSLLPVGNDFIEVVAPIKDGTAGGRYLKRRGGDGGYMVICQCDTHDAQLERRKRALRWHPNRVGAREQRLPRDAVASGPHRRLVLRNRLGRKARARGPLGAGRRRRMAQSETHRSRQLIFWSRAAIARSAGLAERWSKIAGVPLRKDARRRLEMPLDNASVRFVAATDGRGEGLSGIDMVVADRARLNSAAEKRGHKISNDQLTICGTRFYLVSP